MSPPTGWLQARGEFLNEDIFDSTGTFAAKNASSAILGILWPSTAKKSIQIDPPEDMENPSDEERQWYEEVATKRLAAAMDDPKANLALALDEYMIDQVIFGTSGVGVFWEEGLLYKPFGVREMFIDEGKGGRVDTVFLNNEWDAERVIRTYGIDNVSPVLKEKFLNGKTNGAVIGSGSQH